MEKTKTITAYIIYSNLEYLETFSLNKGCTVEEGMYDVVELTLPPGAQVARDMFGEPGIELADGSLWWDVLTLRRKGKPIVPYVTDKNSRPVYLKYEIK